MEDGSKSAPKPRSPPNYPDFCGRRRLQLEVQTLNREVGFLQEELQSLEGLQPVSKCCKAVNEFVGTNPDPLLPIKKKKRGSCYICKWIGSKVCSTFSWIFCCCTGFSKRPKNCICCCPLKNLCCCGYKCDCFHCCKPEVCRCRLPSTTCKSKEGSCCCKLLSCCCFRNLFSCGLPRCCSCKKASCCKNPCCCCFLPTSCTCPEYSCGCVFDCPKCTGVNLCPKCTKPCCVTGCLC